MDPSKRVREGLGQALTGAGGALESADRLCHACVELLEVDGAAISFVLEGSSRGTFGSSSELSRRVDELQFTYGEGPCLDAVRAGSTVRADDLSDPREQRWPAFASAVLEADIRAVLAVPVSIARSPIGALDLFRKRVGWAGDEVIGGASWASQLASLLLANAMTLPTTEDDAGEWPDLEPLDRVEVYQATGMVMAQLGLGPTDALVRLRAHAFANDLTASEVAWQIIEHGLVLESDGPWPDTAPPP